MLCNMCVFSFCARHFSRYSRTPIILNERIPIAQDFFCADPDCPQSSLHTDDVVCLRFYLFRVIIAQMPFAQILFAQKSLIAQIPFYRQITLHRSRLFGILSAQKSYCAYPDYTYKLYFGQTSQLITYSKKHIDAREKL